MWLVLGVAALALLAMAFHFRVTPSLRLSASLYASEAWRLERSGQGTLAALHEDRLSGVSRTYSIRNVERGDVAEFVIRDGVRVGTRVAQGDTLGTITSILIDSRSTELDGLIAVAASELEAVSSGEKPETIQAIETQLEQVGEQIRLQERIEERIHQLQERELASADELDRTRTVLIGLRGEAAVLEAQLRVLQTGARAEDRELARARLSAAQEQLAALRAQRDALAITVPINGEVARAMSDSVLVAVVGTGDWLIAIPVPLGRASEVIPGAAISIWGPGAKQSFPGHIESVESTIIQVGSAPHVLVIARPDSSIAGPADGLRVQVDIALGKRLLRSFAWEWIRSLFSPTRAA